MIPKLTEVVGIAMEPYATKTISVDYVSMTLTDHAKWTSALPSVLQTLEQENMWRPQSMKLRHVQDCELPEVRISLTALADALAALFRKVKGLGPKV